MPGFTFAQRLLSPLAAGLFLPCCTSVDTPGNSGSSAASAGSAIRLELLDATATLDRIVDPGEDPFSEDIFLLTTVCSLRLENLASQALQVSSYYYSPFDDFRLRIFGRSGDLLTVSSHVFSQEARDEPMAFIVPEGTSFVRLVCVTPVSQRPVGDDLPYIAAPALTQEIQLQYVGSFPGSIVRGTVESNRLSVPILDRTFDPQPSRNPPPGVVPEARLPFQQPSQVRT